MTGRRPAPAVREWAIRTTGCTRVARVTVRPLPGGAVSGRVEELALHLTGGPTGDRTVRVVAKSASRHEAAGLRAAQVVRPVATAIPELIAEGEDRAKPWIVTPHFAGTALRDRDPSPYSNLFRSLAHLHVHFSGGLDLPDVIPRVDPSWWRHLCREWARPRIERHRAGHPVDTIARAVALVDHVAEQPAVRRALARVRPTLLHGDVHPGNVIVDDRHAWLIDWGSCRIGPAMLDLANLVSPDSAGFAVYRETWNQVTGVALDAEAVEAGYRWAALQIPVQYLPWMVEHRPTAAVEAALDRAEHALAML